MKLSKFIMLSMMLGVVIVLPAKAAAAQIPAKVTSSQVAATFKARYPRVPVPASADLAHLAALENTVNETRAVFNDAASAYFAARDKWMDARDALRSAQEKYFPKRKILNLEEENGFFIQS